MITKIYDLIVPVSKYQDANGNDKRRWENIGGLFRDTLDGGSSYDFIMLKKIFNPAAIESREGSDSIRISLVKPNNKTQTQTQTQNTNNNNYGESISEVPF